MSKQNLQHLIPIFLSKAELSENTQLAYCSRLHCFRRWTDERGIDFQTMTKEQMLEFLATCKAPRTYNMTIVVLELFYRWMKRLGIETTNPLETVAPQKVKDTIPDPLRKEEVEILLENCKLITYRAPMLLMLYGGLRISEALAVRAKDFWTEGGRLMLKLTGKGDKEREVYICNAEAQAELQQYTASLKPGEKLTCITTSMFEKFAKKIPIENFHPHRLRKTCACTLIEAGMTFEQLQTFLGHSKPETTEIYAKRRLNRRELVMV